WHWHPIYKNTMDPQLNAALAVHILNRLNVAYALINTEMTIIAINPVMAAQWHTSQTELIGQPLDNIIPEIVGMEDMLLMLLEDPEDRFPLSKLQRFDETHGRIYFDLYFEALPAALQTDPPLLLMTMVDMTEHGEMEQTLMQQRNELSLHIAERKRAETALRAEKAQTEHLLLNILPKPIADRLREGDDTIVDNFVDVTILFADIVGFTEWSSRVEPTHLISLLNQVFSVFDWLAQWHKLEKIKTIGDSYMVVGGLPYPTKAHAECIAEMALDMQRTILELNDVSIEKFDIRIGINSGPVIAGVIGSTKFTYDLWGDAVNTASRMETHGTPGRIQISETTYELLKDKYICEPRGEINIKGKGTMMTYFLDGRQ
ncbi:MAG: adenylate/guanylate cyclase domain-containing protein, partial [Okeania sp. SIO3B3]|nr:adenylate/guanylate cyclase domain-containing protein [Okeania sp. SIO3B3]